MILKSINRGIKKVLRHQSVAFVYKFPERRKKSLLFSEKQWIFLLLSVYLFHDKLNIACIICRIENSMFRNVQIWCACSTQRIAFCRCIKKFKYAVVISRETTLFQELFWRIFFLFQILFNLKVLFIFFNNYNAWLQYWRNTYPLSCGYSFRISR